MAARFLARGERLICLPAMGAEYVPRDSLRGLWSQYLAYGEYRARTYRRHPASMRASHLLAPAIVAAAGAAVATPGRVARLARAGLVLYAASLATAGVRALPAAESPGDAALVPAVLIIMHFAHGVGQMQGWVRHGPPWPALARLAGLERLIAVPAGDAGSVHAPSLQLSPTAPDEGVASVA
jgi:hypothetical protein